MSYTLYKPDHPRYPKIFVGDGLPEDVGAAQVAMAALEGYTGFRPENADELPWVVDEDIMRLRTERGCPVVVLSHTKFLRNLADIGLAMRFLRHVRRDSALLGWWFDDRTVSPRSPEFGRLAALLRVGPKDFMSHCLAGMSVDGK